jgi:protein-disulfide isomerase
MPVFDNLPNADAVLADFAKLVGVPLTARQVSSELEIHPHYPNMLALNDVLNNFGIPTSAYKLAPEELGEVPCPFIAHTRVPGMDYLLVTKLDTDSLEVSDHKRKKYTLHAADFYQIFDGIVLVADEDVAIIKPDKPKFDAETARKPFAYALFCVLALGVLLLRSEWFYNWQIVLAAFFKVAGSGVSVLLLIQSIDKNNPLIQSLCGGDSKANCNAILTSKAAKVFSWLSWSEVGFFYFGGSLLAMLFATPAVLPVLAIINMLCLPYTIYSVYYQGIVARQWCVLCCTVQALLWLEFIPLASFLSKRMAFPNWDAAVTLVVCFCLPVLMWISLKPVLIQAGQVKSLKQQLRRFKYDTASFTNMLKDQAKYVQPGADWSIVLGSQEADNVISMVSNPYCQPCAATHHDLDELLKYNPNLQARVIFAIGTNNDDDRAVVARHLMALGRMADDQIVTCALNDWYNQKQKNYADWAKTHPVQLDAAIMDVIQKQKDWCELAEITTTPTILLNGYRLPPLYQLKDLKYMLE